MQLLRSLIYDSRQLVALTKVMAIVVTAKKANGCKAILLFVGR